MEPPEDKCGTDLTARQKVGVQEAVHVGCKQVGKAAVEDPKLAQEEGHAPLLRLGQQPPQHRPCEHPKVVAAYQVCRDTTAVSQVSRIKG